MKELKVAEIAKATGGKILRGRPGQTVSRVSRDSRDVDDRTVFFALVGENVDAHSFLPDVAEAGCSVMVISGEQSAASVEDELVTLVLVDDTTKALQRLAYWYLRQLNVTVIGVTGSVGKTTTKDLLAAACSVKYNTVCTKGNYNNHIGLPLTVFEFDEDTQVGILEMGMDKYGEIDFLANLARPHIAVITAIGSAHMEFFGSRENIMKAKMEITNYLTPKDTLVIGQGADLLRPENVTGDYRVVSAGTEDNCDFMVSGVTDNGEAGMEFDLKNMWMSQHFSIPAHGAHNVVNAAVAVAAAAELGVTMKEAAEGMKDAVLTGNRLSFKRNEKKNIDIIDDTYNASPEAMKAAIDILAGTGGADADKDPGRKIAVLGDMYELGERSQDIHEEIGRYAVEKKIDLVIGAGELGSHIASGAGDRGKAFETKKDLKKKIDKLIKSGDMVLVKASHGMAMEEIVDLLMK